MSASSPSGEILSERDAYIALNLLPFSPAGLQRHLKQWGSAGAALDAAAAGDWPSSAERGLADVEPPGGVREATGSSPLGGDPSGGSGRSPIAQASRRTPAQVKALPDRPGLLDAASAARLGVRGLLSLARDQHERARARDFRIVTVVDDEFPSLLREIPDPPPVLYIWGRLEPDDEVRIALVGSRHATPGGLEVAEQLGRRLALRGVCIVSGLARGIDAAAHRGALSAPGRTLALLGSGLERIYPRENLELARKVAASGAVLSEYPLGLGPLRQLFPRRNRLIAGLSAGVVIVEAAAESGALGTARLALEQGREVYAVPGSILSGTSVGTNRLLRDGAAHLVTCTQDVLRELPAAFRMRLGLPASHEDQRRDGAEGARPGPPGASRSARLPLFESDPAGVPGARASRFPATEAGDPDGADGQAGGPLDDPDARALWARLGFDAGLTVDELVEKTGLGVARLLAALSTLELHGLVASRPGNRVSKARPDGS